MKHIVDNEDKMFFTSSSDLSSQCNQLMREKKKQKEYIGDIEAEMRTAEPAKERLVALKAEMSNVKRQAIAQTVKDANVAEQFKQQEQLYLNMVQQVKSLTQANKQLVYSLTTMQQQHQGSLQVRPPSCCFHHLPVSCG